MADSRPLGSPAYQHRHHHRHRNQNQTRLQQLIGVRIAALIQQEVQKPTAGADENTAITTTQNTPLADLKLTSQGLFDESKALWEEFVAFDQEHQLAQRVGAQLWRITKAVGKPVLILSLKGVQTALVTVADADKRAALVERFSRSEAAQTSGASLEATED